MNTLRNASSLRLAVVVTMLLSWFTITNHCALGLMKPTAQAERMHSACCSGKTAPAKEAPQTGGRECCKSIHAALPGTVAVTFDAFQFHLELPIFAPWDAPRLIAAAGESFVRDHGPPRSLTFAELVLQRSLLSHAPPSAI